LHHFRLTMSGVAKQRRPLSPTWSAGANVRICFMSPYSQLLAAVIAIGEPSDNHTSAKGAMNAGNRRPIILDPRTGRRLRRRLITPILGFVLIGTYGYFVAIALGRLGIALGIGKQLNIVLVLSFVAGSMILFTRMWNKYLALRPIDKPLMWLFFYEVKPRSDRH